MPRKFTLRSPSKSRSFSSSPNKRSSEIITFDTENIQGVHIIRKGSVETPNGARRSLSTSLNEINITPTECENAPNAKDIDNPTIIESESKEFVSSTENSATSMERPTHLDLPSLQSPSTCGSNQESPAFKFSDVFLFRNVADLDDISNLLNFEFDSIDTKSVANDSENTLKEEVGKQMRQVRQGGLKTEPETLDMKTHHLDLETSSSPVSTAEFLKSQRSHSLSEESDNLTRSQRNSDFFQTTQKDNVFLDNPEHLNDKVKKSITFGRYSMKNEKKVSINYRRSYSECDRKSSSNFEKVNSLKKRFFSQKIKNGDYSFLKEILRKNRKEPSRSFSDGSEKVSSPWHIRRQGGGQVCNDGGGSSAPSSPQTGSKFPKLPFWRRAKPGKNQLDSSSECIGDRDCENAGSESPNSVFGSPIHFSELNLQGNLRKSILVTDNETYDCLRYDELRKENSLKIRIQEAKGIPDKRSYLCVLTINGIELRETTLKYKDGICFWGEQFEFLELHEVKRIGIRLVRDDGKRIGSAEFEPNSSNANPKLDEWIKLVPEKTSKEKEPIAIRIRYTFQKVTILPLIEYNRFTKYLKESSLTLCRKLEPLMNAKAKEEFVSSLMNILHHNGKAVSFLNQLIISDVKRTGDNKEVLFRANSMATKAIEAYMRLVGQNYLNVTLKSSIDHIIRTDLNMEIDCSRLPSNSSPVLERRENLLVAVEGIWSNIVESPKNFPPEIQEVFFAVKETLDNVEHTNQLISASVFLRFLCPAVMSPNLFGLLKEYPGKKSSRRLTLVAKTLQTLANFSSFQSKEDCMQFLNPFIERERDRCLQFLNDISGPRPRDESKLKYGGTVSIGRHLALLHLHLRELLSTSDIQTTDVEMRQLMIQVSHVDDCLLRHERKALAKQEDQWKKISTSLVYNRSPSQGRRSDNENTDRNCGGMQVPEESLSKQADRSGWLSSSGNTETPTTGSAPSDSAKEKNMLLKRASTGPSMPIPQNAQRSSISNNINILNNNMINSKDSIKNSTLKETFKRHSDATFPNDFKNEPSWYADDKFHRTNHVHNNTNKSYDT